MRYEEEEDAIELGFSNEREQGINDENALDTLPYFQTSDLSRHFM